jgi:hypothetical protein
MSKRIKRIKGGHNNEPTAVVGSAWEGGDINTWVDSNHLPLSESGVSPFPAGINTRDLLFGGRKPKKSILKRTGKSLKKNNTTKKIRFAKNKKSTRHQSKKRHSKIKLLKKGGSGFLPDDISNLKDSLTGGLISLVNGYRGVPTPYQVNHTYPYQQQPYNESYSSTISDANAIYNNADNVVLSTY